MKTYVQPGEVVTLTAPTGGVVSGTPYRIGSLVVIAAASAAEGARFSAHVTGVFRVPKAAGAAWTEGEKLYWDDTAKAFTPSATGNTLAGVAVMAAAEGATSGAIRLDGVAR